MLLIVAVLMNLTQPDLQNGNCGLNWLKSNLSRLAPRCKLVLNMHSTSFYMFARRGCLPVLEPESCLVHFVSSILDFLGQTVRSVRQTLETSGIYPRYERFASFRHVSPNAKCIQNPNAKTKDRSSRCIAGLHLCALSTRVTDLKR